MSGRNWLPVTTGWLIKPGKSKYKLDPSTPTRLEAAKFKTELCRHVNLPSSYVLHPAITCKGGSVSEREVGRK